MKEDAEQYQVQDPTTPQACCEGGSCCPPARAGASQKVKLIAFVLIVVAAGVVLANSLMRRSRAEADQSRGGFATDMIASALQTASSQPAAGSDSSTVALASPWETSLSSLDELNTASADIQAVFVLVGSESDRASAALSQPMAAAVKALKGGGGSLRTYYLQPGTADYENLSKQAKLPCILAMVKGGGMAVVSDEVSESKLIQAYVTASRPGSACCPGGSCCPTP